MLYVFPMAGEGSRFKDQGCDNPKYTLPLGVSNVFSEVVKPFLRADNESTYLFILNKDRQAYEFVLSELKKLKIKSFLIVTINTPTLGQAHTVYLGLKEIETKLYYQGMLIYNIDTVRRVFSVSKFMKLGSGYLEVFKMPGNQWSFIEPGENNTVIRTTEKNRISPFASTGLYYFNSIITFKEIFEQAYKVRAMDKGEFYIAPLYNFIIESGGSVYYDLIEPKNIIPCGTPEEYENSKSYF